MSVTPYTIQKIIPRKRRGDVVTVVPIGTFEEVVGVFKKLNTGPEFNGGTEMWGPGFRVHCEFEDGSASNAHGGKRVVKAILLSVNETEQELFNLLLEGPLARAIMTHGWELCNTESGQTFPRRRDDDELEDEDISEDVSEEEAGETSGGG
jgi:hypothetical protein